MNLALSHREREILTRVQARVDPTGRRAFCLLDCTPDEAGIVRGVLARARSLANTPPAPTGDGFTMRGREGGQHPMGPVLFVDRAARGN